MKAIVTGASRGLGNAIANYLGGKGYDLILLASKEDHLIPVKEELESSCGVEVQIVGLDFTSDSAEASLQSIFHNNPEIDVLVNNVGAFEMGGLEQVTWEQVERLFKVNFQSCFQLSQLYLNQFKERKSGTIINIGSIVSEHPRKDVAAYTISKAALTGYSKMLCDEMKDFGVKVCEIVPGSIATSSWDGIVAPKEDFVQVEDIVASIDVVLSSSKGANFEKIIVRPTNRNF